MTKNGKPETIGKRLRRLRLERHLSQRDLSSPGVSYAYISRIEAEARTPSVKALRKLAEKLGVTVEYLETGVDQTLVDDLVAELFDRTGLPVRTTFVPHAALVRWQRDELRLSTTRENLTEALLAAVGQERERDRLRDEQARLAERERALR
jgi:transcriptional regulator with XRE-family HTH domain